MLNDALLALIDPLAFVNDIGRRVAVDDDGRGAQRGTVEAFFEGGGRFFGDTQSWARVDLWRVRYDFDGSTELLPRRRLVDGLLLSMWLEMGYSASRLWHDQTDWLLPKIEGRA